MSERFHNPIHWRLNSQRYRLEGVRYINGEISLQTKYKSIDQKPTQKLSNLVTSSSK
ncbi:MAG TPA: hypothetical protein VG895_03365 [Patescibacteria group bacterium]|nr:hypothetical protein [Patescibacteria group bacterium]